MKRKLWKPRLSWSLAGLLLLSLGMAGCTKPPPPATPFGQIAQAAYENGDYQEAIANFTRAIGQEGSKYGYLFYRGACYKELGRYSEAVSDFKAAMQARPNDNGQSAAEIAKILLRQQDYAGALSSLEAVLKHTPDNYEVLFLRASCLYHTGKLTDAIEELADLAPKLGSTANGLAALSMRARALMKQQKYNDARQLFEQYLGAKAVAGQALTDDDKYWAGRIFFIQSGNKADQEKWWSQLPRRFKPSER